MKSIIVLLLSASILSSWGIAAPLILIEPGQPVPGSSITVRMAADGIEQAGVKFLGRQFALFRQDNEWKTVIGIPLEIMPGNKPLIIELQKNGGSREEIKQAITVSAKKFPTAWFWLKPAKKKLLLARDLTANEWSQIENKLLREDPAQGWSGKFALPVSGEVSMVFGTIERVNKMKRGQHRGMDIAVPVGTEVRAANSGRVVFAEKLKVFGGTMVIDHGLGVHSLYFHLSRFIAQPGETVVKGQKIALSGNTGASSGPHLHWGMSVHDLRVDPRQWTIQEM